MKIDKNNYEIFFLDYSEGNLSSEQVVELKLFLESNPDLKAELDFFESDIKLEPKNVAVDLGLMKILDTNHSDEEMIIAYLEGDLSESESRSIECKINQDKNFKSLFQSFQGLRLKPNERTKYDWNALLLLTLDTSNYQELFVAYHENDLSLINRLRIEKYASENGLESELNAYSKLKLSSDSTIIFSDKNGLKRKKTRIIPLYAWVSSVAALLLLFFVLSYDSEPKEKFAKENQVEKEIEKINVKEAEQKALPLVQEVESTKESIRIVSESAGKINTSKESSLRKEEKPNKRIELPYKEQRIAGEENHPKERIDSRKKSNDKLEFQNEEIRESIDEGIAVLPELKRKQELIKKKNTGNKLNIIALAEKATKNSELISFQSNLNEAAVYNETTFSIGKFSIKRKTKRRKKT